MTHFRLQRHGALALEFDGELLADVNADDGLKDRWQHMKLYRTTAGRYVLERLGESRVEGEVTMSHVDELDDAEAVQHRVERRRDDGRKYFTIIALDLLDQAATVDDAFKSLTERI